MADPVKLLRRPKINADCLGVPNVQISIGFGWETGVHLHSFTAPAFRQILRHKILNKIAGVHFFRRNIVFFFCHSDWFFLL